MVRVYVCVDRIMFLYYIAIILTESNLLGTFGPVLFESSAYPMALECLREVGCEDTEVSSSSRVCRCVPV